MLKLKAWFYRRTGIFLAHREQCEFIDSQAYWSEWQSCYRDTTQLRDVHGLVIGAWQAEHGFARPMTWFDRWRTRRRFAKLKRQQAALRKFFE